MAYIEHFGLSPDDHEFMNSDEFKAIMNKYPHLIIVDQEEQELTLPLKKSGYAFVNDPSVPADDYGNPHQLTVLFDDYAEVEDPSEPFIEILKLMEKAWNAGDDSSPFFVSTDEDYESYEGVEEVGAVYDFTVGDYVIPANRDAL